MPTESNELKKKLKKDIGEAEKIYLRLHRAISWLKASEEQEVNSDIKFMCLWIAFNSCYAVDDFTDLKNAKTKTESNRFIEFLKKLVSCDHSRRLYSLLWNRYSSEIRLILENKFLFKSFWDYQRGDELSFKAELEKSIENANKFLSKGDVVSLLMIVLDRLYVLRNQIFHGGATYKSRMNRVQIKDASTVLSRLLPIIIELIIDNKNEDWGLPYYPVINTQ